MGNNIKKDMKIVKVELKPEDRLKKALEKIKKECIRVMPVKAGFKKEQAADVRFAGPAYAEAGDKPVICEGCGKPLSFVFQFHDKYDENMKPSGDLHSVYYCFDCSPIGRPDEEHGQYLVVTHKNPEVSKFVEVKENADKKLKATSCTLSKTYIIPDYDSIENDYPEIAEICEEIDCEDPMSAYEDAGNEIGCLMEPSTVIGGYPIWLQGYGDQKCPECEGRADLACQIDSEDAVKLMFGDAGSLYVFRCPKHKDKFSVEMQCF